MDVAVGWCWRSQSPGLKGPNTQAAFDRPHYAGREAAGYTEQALKLIDGGVDVVQPDACQDILQAKAGLVGIFDALKKPGKNVSVQV